MGCGASVRRSVETADLQAHDGRTEVSISLCFTLREPSAAVTAIYDRSYHGNIKEDAKECFVSFPGKFTSGWDVLIRELNRNQSVACVFLQTPEEGLGQHLPDPEHPERCHCHKIYGVEDGNKRNFKNFGYILNCDKETEDVQKKAKAMNAVILCPNFSDEEKERRTAEAESICKRKKTCAWGCAWYQAWLDNVRKAVEKKQRLKVVYFPDQVGQGKVEMEHLNTADLWDGVGCGTSQKGEIATLDEMRKKSKEDKSDWDYDEIDVFTYLRAEFKQGTIVDAFDSSTNKWRRGSLIQVRHRRDKRDAFLWKVRCLESQKDEVFESTRVRHVADSISSFLNDVGSDRVWTMLKSTLPRGVEVVTDLAEQRLRNGLPACTIELLVKDIQALQTLRDMVLSENLEASINTELRKVDNYRLRQLRVLKTEFFMMYEKSLQSFSRLTAHQREKLREMEDHGYERLHLSAPAGAGKTFVALHYVLNTLTSSSGYVVYVAPSKCLCLQFLTWLATRVGHGSKDARKVEAMLGKVKVIHFPYDRLQTAGIDRASRITLKVGKDTLPSGMVLAIFDESHDIFRPGHARRLAEKAFNEATQCLLLSDQSQSGSLEHEFPELHRVKLTEVVRSTKRIVAGAAAFEYAGQQEVNSLGTDGPALKTYIFEAKDETGLYTQYANYTSDAITYVIQSYSELWLQGRLALLLPDAGFLEGFRPVLQEVLQERFASRNLCLVSFEDSMGHLHLPEQLEAALLAREEIVLDTVHNAKGLERMIVICIGLDEAITGSAGDAKVRAGLYQGISRAQLMAIVVNRFLPEGWLAFLRLLRYQDMRKFEAAALREMDKGSAAQVMDALKGARQDMLEPEKKQPKQPEEPLPCGQLAVEVTVVVEDAQLAAGADMPVPLTLGEVADSDGNDLNSLESLAPLRSPHSSLPSAAARVAATGDSSKPALSGPAHHSALREERDTFIWDTGDNTITNASQLKLRFNPISSQVKLSDRGFLLKAVAQRGLVLELALEELRADSEVVLAAVAQNGSALQFASQELRADREVVLAAVGQNGSALEHASEELFADRGVVLAAAAQNGWALEHASQELRADREVVLAAVAQNGRALEYASQELRADREVVLGAVVQRGDALRYASQELRADRKVVLGAVVQRGDALRYASQELWGGESRRSCAQIARWFWGRWCNVAMRCGMPPRRAARRPRGGASRGDTGRLGAAVRLPGELLTQMNHVFQEIDQNGNGAISWVEFQAEKRNSRRPRLLSAGQVRSPRTVSWPDAGSPRGADEVTMMLCPRPSKPVPAELHSVTWPDAGSPRGADEVTMMLCPRPSKPVLPEFHSVTMMLCPRPSKLVLPEFHSVTWPDAGSPRGAGEVTMMLCPRPFKPVLPEFHSVTWPDAGSPRGADEVTMMLCRA
ncbi:unnamed protein product [Effrenium voratum]|uniref:Uncharacterized protein n=1 Tax=Effrenium voratum TaxID=2562239 RepID=A0AA36NCJ4_9DINO|nr:unnamed protein product [Effrenium voratum]